MPQIWMTYDELAALLPCQPADARNHAIALNLARRKSRDGHTRVKLDAALNARFFDQMLALWTDRQMQACAADLRMMRDRMAAYEDIDAAPKRAMASR